jgi:SAM-dependent methyltransferase
LALANPALPRIKLEPMPSSGLQEWDERHRNATERDDATPVPLVIATASEMKPGRALDLASGAGRNALWLAEHGWSVTAVDGSPAAIELLRERALKRGLKVNAQVVDLEKGQYAIEPAQWDLVVISYYLQRDLFEPAKRGVVPGGVLAAIVLLGGGRFSLPAGELRGYFSGWEILHDREGNPGDSPGHRAVTEIVARRPYKLD